MMQLKREKVHERCVYSMFIPRRKCSFSVDRYYYKKPKSTDAFFIQKSFF